MRSALAPGGDELLWTRKVQKTKFSQTAALQTRIPRLSAASLALFRRMNSAGSEASIIMKGNFTRSGQNGGVVRVGIVGGGLQGVGVALELSRRGASVDLFEKRDSCLTQASLQNEGKVHLGFVYAKDPQLATARLMAEGALQFEPILRSWLETETNVSPTSSAFQYLVHRDTLLQPDELAAYYNAVTQVIESEASRAGGSYFGHDACAPVRRVDLSEVARGEIAAVFETPEVAVDPERIAAQLCHRIESDDRIRIQTNTKVICVVPESRSVRVELDREGHVEMERYDHVVNASWEDLLVIDASAGVAPAGAWSFRVKHFLRIRGLQHRISAPSATIVLGAFGDVVRYGNGDVFLSWYPVGRVGTSYELKPPNWPIPLMEPIASNVRTGIFQELCRIVPSLKELEPYVDSADLFGGIIYALGVTDVNDPSSRLHERHSVGPRSFNRYHSVNTGKYTLAPLFAKRTADRILPSRYA